MYQLSDFNKPLPQTNKAETSAFMNLLQSKWEEIHNTNTFRYKICNLRERLVDDKYLLQLNTDRGTKRRTPEQIDNILQPFDKEKFNFTRASQKEVILSIGKNIDDPDLHSLLVNISPISQYHSLFCPFINKCLIQAVTKESLELVINIMFLAKDRNLKIAFNSLCALASVNHLHYHLLTLDTTLPVEKVKWNHLQGPLYILDDSYPVQAFCFMIEQHEINVMVQEIFKLCEYFLRVSIAHNIFITKKSLTEDENVKVIIYPRQSTFGVKQSTAFYVAALEFSGWLTVYCEQAFQSLTSEDIENELKKWRLNNFDKLCEDVKALF